MKPTKTEKINRMLSFVNKSLEEKYETITLFGQKSFILPMGLIIRVTFVNLYDGFFVVEYADNMEEAQKNIFWDGDQFFFDEYNEATLFEAIFSEIKCEIKHATE